MTLIFTSKSFDTSNKLFRFNFIFTIKTNFLLVMRHFGQSLKKDNLIRPDERTWSSDEGQTNKSVSGIGAGSNLDSLEADIEKQPRHRHSNLLTWSFGDSQGRVTWIEMETNKLVYNFNPTILSPGHGWAQPEKLLGHHSNLEKENNKIESKSKVESSQFTLLELMLLYLKFLLTFNINWPGERDSWSDHWLLPLPREIYWPSAFSTSTRQNGTIDQIKKRIKGIKN